MVSITYVIRTIQLTIRSGRLNGKLRFLAKELSPIVDDNNSKCTYRSSEAMEMRSLGLNVCFLKDSLKWDTQLNLIKDLTGNL